MDASLCAGAGWRGAFLFFPEMPLQVGMGDRQVLLDAPTCSSMAHGGGRLASLLGDAAAVFGRRLRGGYLDGSRDVLDCWEIQSPC